MNIVITGGMGFIGANLAINLSQNNKIIIIDNLLRKENKKNYKKLKDISQIFIEDVSSIKKIKNIDCILHLASDPSVMAGISYKSNIIKNNIQSTFECLEICKDRKIPLIFFSSSRVYPIETINNLKYERQKKRFNLISSKKGIKKGGFNENFDLNGLKSIYGFSKYSSEQLIFEYAKIFDFKFIINRLGLTSGYLQNGHINQGILSFMVKKWVNREKFDVIGYNGYQVRDILNVHDLCNLISKQIETFSSKKFLNKIYNVGGGLNFSYSLNQIIQVLDKMIGLNPKLGYIDQKRLVDIKYYVTDNTKVMNDFDWYPKLDISHTIKDIIKSV